MTITKPYDLLLFDLDGTISDPIEGISNCINFALESYGYPTRTKEFLASFIGPPIDKTFDVILGNLRNHSLDDLVAKYRERYMLCGFKENAAYEGILDILSSLSSSGSIKLAICTSKRADIASQVLDCFGLSKFFAFVSGGDVGIEKWQQIESLKQQGKISLNTLMIGDRASDLIGAHRNGIDSAGVLWGYGSREELEAEQPAYLLNHPRELLQFIP